MSLSPSQLFDHQVLNQYDRLGIPDGDVCDHVHPLPRDTRRRVYRNEFQAHEHHPYRKIHFSQGNSGGMPSLTYNGGSFGSLRGVSFRSCRNVESAS
jgi:hypothetical protein